VNSRNSGWKYHQIEEAEFGRRSESGRRLIGKLRDLEKLGMIRFNPESKRYVSTSEGNEFVEFVESLEEHLYERI
jgi:predicted transcriptional regulator